MTPDMSRPIRFTNNFNGRTPAELSFGELMQAMKEACENLDALCNEPVFRDPSGDMYEGHNVAETTNG